MRVQQRERQKDRQIDVWHRERPKENAHGFEVHVELDSCYPTSRRCPRHGQKEEDEGAESGAGRLWREREDVGKRSVRLRAEF